MKNFCFTVDDNIRVLKEITESGYQSIFEHPYLAMYRRLHKEFGLKVQLNLFYRLEEFVLPQVTDRFYDEWKRNSHWLKLSFHSDLENIRPYENSSYDEVYTDCKNVNDQIIRFASPDALADTTTIHYCLLNKEGIRAMEDNKVVGLLGLFGTREDPRTSYEINDSDAALIRSGEILKIGNISYGAIDIVLNRFSKEDILEKLELLKQRSTIKVMIHEQYFYEDYKNYQPDFEDKLRSAFSFLLDRGYQSAFFEDMLV